MASGLQPVPITPQKHDPAWKHVQMFKNGDRVQLKCIYCGKLFKGGGIHRIKEHLAGQKGNASSCLQVQQDVRLLMQQSLDGVVVKKRKKQKLAEEITGIHLPSNDIDTYDNNQCEVNTDIQLIANPIAIEPSSTLMVSHEAGTSSRSREKRKRGRPPKNSLVSASTDLITANGIEYEFKKPDSQVHMAIARFLCDVGVPLDAVNSFYFQQLIDAISSQGMGVVAPSYHDLQGCVLKSLLEEGKTQIEHYARTWGRTGCSILVEDWCTDKGMILANFLVYCPKGTMFLKSADITNIANSSDTLFELLKEVVEEVGVRNVLQVITSSEEQYAVAGRKLSDAYPTLYWAPCAAGSLDLILDDFGKIEWIKTVLEQSKSITRFIYNHSVVLNMMRRYTFGVDLVVPRSTSSVSNFTTLKRMVEHKHNLQALVTSQEWVDSSYSKKEGGLALLDSISDTSFWSSCTLIVHLTNPLLRVLRIVSSQNKPSIGYIYAGIYRAKEIIKKELVKKEDYLGYWNIIDQRWAQSRHLPLHAAGFYLNPKFFYSIKGDLHDDVVSGMFDCIERLVTDAKVQDKIIKELSSYKHAVGDFGQKMTIRARDTLIPAEWWSTYGGGCPNLARLAVRILSQRCSLMHCKHDLIPFEQIHNTKNSLEHQRLTDLVFTQYNLRLRRMTDMSKEQDIVDPVSFNSISVRDWIAGKELCLEDLGSSDWMALDPPSSNTTLSIDETEELGAEAAQAAVGGIVDSEPDANPMDVPENVDALAMGSLVAVVPELIVMPGTSKDIVTGSLASEASKGEREEVVEHPEPPAVPAPGVAPDSPSVVVEPFLESTTVVRFIQTALFHRDELIRQAREEAAQAVARCREDETATLRQEISSTREEVERLKSDLLAARSHISELQVRSVRAEAKMRGRLAPEEMVRVLDVRFWEGILLCRRIASVVAPHVSAGIFDPRNDGVQQNSLLTDFSEEAGASHT